MPFTEADVDKALADYQAGVITEEAFYKLIDGEVETEPVKEDVEPEPEAEPAKVETEPEPEAEPAKVETEPEPVILARDGVHTIPYSELTEARDAATKAAEQIAVLRAQLAEKTNAGAQMAAAQKKDEATGTTESTDALVNELAEEFPSAAKLITALQSQVKSLQDKQSEVEIAAQAVTARQAFDLAVAAIEPQYKAVEADPKFWEWFKAAPPHIQAAKDSSDPKVIASIVRTYLDDTKAPPAPVSDITKKKVAAAIENAEKTPSVNSLGDIPGGSNPAHDELETLKSLNAFDLSERMSGKTPREIEALMARML